MNSSLTKWLYVIQTPLADWPSGNGTREPEYPSNPTHKLVSGEALTHWLLVVSTRSSPAVLDCTVLKRAGSVVLQIAKTVDCTVQ